MKRMYTNCLYFTSGVLARKAERLANKSFGPVNLGPSYAFLLLLVIENPGIQPKEVSEQLQLSPSTITRLADKLEKKKMIVRINEGKVSNIYPSPSSKILYPVLLQCIANFKEHCYAQLGIQESKVFTRYIAEIADKLGP